MDIDIHLDGRWHPCAQVALADAAQASRRGSVALRYDSHYAIERLEAFDYRALTVRAPVTLGVISLPCWPSFLIDLLPQGAARRRLERLDAGPLSEWELLERGGANPVGNLRIRARAPRDARTHAGFELHEMVSRGDAFIDYANEVGATVAGATDTQGDAPKFWVIQDEHERWHPDSGDLGARARRFALLKFPVPEAGPRAEDILRNEAAFQQVAARLGLRVTSSLPQFVDGALLIPRFDRRRENDKEIRLGVESLYSVAGVLDSSSAPLTHHAALSALSRCLTDFAAEITEYVRRDLLNLALGNRDNHGRNTAILKDTDGSMRLAPLFDLGPSYLDARALARVMRWSGENPAGTDWNHVLDNLLTNFGEAGLPQSHVTSIAHVMREFVPDLVRLPQLMGECGVDVAIVKARQPEIEQLARQLGAIR